MGDETDSRYALAEAIVRLVDELRRELKPEPHGDAPVNWNYALIRDKASSLAEMIVWDVYRGNPANRGTAIPAFVRDRVHALLVANRELVAEVVLGGRPYDGGRS